MAEHFQEVVDYVMGEDESELAKTKAELAYALHSLEREISICAMTQTRLDQAEADRESYKEQMIRAQLALHDTKKALENIAVYGCGMLSQPPAMNSPEEAWLRMRIAEYERCAREALALVGGVRHD